VTGSKRDLPYAFEFLGEIEEPNWKDFAEQVEIYTSRALVKVDDEVGNLSRDL
jgi:hypothetical protein